MNKLNCLNFTDKQLTDKSIKTHENSWKTWNVKCSLNKSIVVFDEIDFLFQQKNIINLEKKAEAEESSLSTQRKHAGLLRRELEWLKKGPKARSTKQKARIDRAHALQAT